MEIEILHELLLESSSQNLKMQIHMVLSTPNQISNCFDEGTFENLLLLNELAKESHSKEQLFGLSTMLLEALSISQRPNKFETFYKALQGLPSSYGLLRLQNGSREQMLFSSLAQYYTKQASGQPASVHFDSLASDDLLAALVATNSLTDADMALLNQAGLKKDTVLLSVLVTKPKWPQQLIAAMIQSGLLDLLDEVLPAFHQFFVSNFTFDLADTRIRLMAGGDQRRAASVLIDEAMDLYFCLNYDSLAVNGLNDPIQRSEASTSRNERTDPLQFGASNKALDETNIKQLQCRKKLTELDMPPLQSEPATKLLKVVERANLSNSDFNEEGNDAIESQESDQLQMRVYQEELASSGVAGLNSVIIAPTGSGKTLVSIRIAAARLAENPSDARVCFLADRKHLVEQQFAAFKAQLPREFRDRIVCSTGGEVDRPPLNFLLRDHSVLIMSTQILLNSLMDKSEDGLNGDLTRFRLIIFDECHHCAKDHPSSKIMEFYFQQREQRSDANLPQIIGLTASPGTGQANKRTDAAKHVLRLCASLDCQRLVTVRRCAESLQRHVINPDVQLHRTGRKVDDPVRLCIDQLMDKAEQGLSTAAERIGFAQLVPPQRNSFLYTNFCGELRSRLVARFVEAATAWRHLHHCNVASLLWSLFRCTDALQYIEDHLCEATVLVRQPTCLLDAELRDLLQQHLLPKMRAHCAENPVAASRSPALSQLRQILTDQFQRQPDSRALVFVQQRCFAGVVKSFLDEATEFNQTGIRIGVMTGANASGCSGGITQIGQSDLLAEFRRGSVKILISTSVTEEGLDVQKCNVVVRFCHVTNEIAMVQSRGRGRAEGSTYHVIVPDEMSWLGEKERLNQARDVMMLEAVAQLSDLSDEDFARKVQVEQRSLREEAHQKQKLQAIAVNLNRDSAFSIDCLECKTPLTSSDRLRLAQGCHRLALDAELITNRLEPRRVSAVRSFTNFTELGVALLCRNCGAHVANLCRFKELDFPEIKVQAIRFVDIKTKQQHGPFKKWKLVQRILTEIEIASKDMIEWAAIVPDIRVPSL